MNSAKLDANLYNWLCIIFNEKYDVLIFERWFIKLERPTQTKITSHTVFINWIQLNRKSVNLNKMQFAQSVKSNNLFKHSIYKTKCKTAKIFTS